MSDNSKETFYGTELAGLSFFAMFSVYVLIAFTGNLILTAFNQGETVVGISVRAVFSVVSMILVISFINKKRHEKIFLTVFIKKTSSVNFLFSLILACGMYFTFGAVNDALVNAVESAGLKTSGISVPLSSVPELIIFSVLLGVFPAIEEECFFRGLLLENLLCGGKRIVAVLICALCFALYHGSVSQLVYQFIFGVALSFLAIKSESVLPCIIAHYLNNQAILLLNYFDVVINFNSAVTIIVGVALLMVFIVYLVWYKINVFKMKLDVMGGGISRFFIPYGIIAIALCLIMIIGGFFF